MTGCHQKETNEIIAFLLFYIFMSKKQKNKKSLGVRARFRLVRTDIVHFGPDSK